MGQSITYRQAMKIENQRKIINLINKTPVSRNAISEQTGLTQASVSMIVDELIKEGLIEETEKYAGEAIPGRRPILLDINADWGYVVGVSIDRDGIDLGLTNVKGQVIDQFERFPTTSDYRACLDAIAEKVKALIGRNKQVSGKLVGAGVAVPGPFDTQNGVILKPPGFFEEWYGVRLLDELKKRLDMPIYVEHNSTAFAIAEKNLGKGTQFDNFVLLNINAGLGAGLVLKGKIYPQSCELGHTSIDFNGRLCSCGNRGCLEQYASVSAMLYDVNRVRPEIGSWKQLVDLAEAGDEFCVRSIETEAGYLSLAILNLINLLGIHAAIIAGKASYRPELLLAGIRRKLSEVNPELAHSFEVGTSIFTENVYVISGAAVLLDKVFNSRLFFYHSKASRKTPTDNKKESAV